MVKVCKVNYDCIFFFRLGPNKTFVHEFAFLLQILIVGHYHINVVSLVNTAKVKANGAR